MKDIYRRAHFQQHLPDMDCLVCYKKKCDKRPNCMDELSVDQLFQAVKKELGKI